MIRRSRIRHRRRPMAEINVVPYIDVMLVLLVIFMVTAPLITQGVKVSLPRESAGPLPGDGPKAVVIAVAESGEFYLDAEPDRALLVDEADLLMRVRDILGRQPGTPVLVRADTRVDYGRVIRAMVLAQQAGAPEVGLITTPPERRAPRP